MVASGTDMPAWEASFHLPAQDFGLRKLQITSVVIAAIARRYGASVGSLWLYGSVLYVALRPWNLRQTVCFAFWKSND